MNDNIMSVMSSAVLQHFYYTNNIPIIPISDSRTLFVFRKLGGDSPSISLLYRVLNELYGNNVQPAKALLKGGPHCVQHMTWGTGMKPFYRDSLIDLRRVVFQVFHETLRKTYAHVKPAPELTQLAGHSNPRVLIVTRNTTKPDPSPFRKLSANSERDLKQAFERKGSPAVICCNFQFVSTTKSLVSYFGHADICIGIHGAGLANCILSSENMIVVELQNEHAFGFDSFMKIAHMANGVYVFYDIRHAVKHRGIGAGSVLDAATIESIVDLCLLLFSRIQEQRLAGHKVSYRSLLRMSNVIGNGIIHFKDDYDLTMKLWYPRDIVKQSDRDKFLIVPSGSYDHMVVNVSDIYGIYSLDFSQ
jgi:Glycosyltransferase 61